MSTIEDPPPAPPQREYIIETGMLMFFGICFLFPGLCSLYFIIALTIEKHGNPLSDPYLQIVALLWVICFAVSIGGIAMILAARKRAKAGV
jgi:drug/metabolite transporter (DMT)-like permease